MSTDASMSATISCDVLVVGGGAAGLSAAAAAADRGASVVVVERDHELGGILNQCIHNGFGLHRFGEELTGPEFAARDVARVEAAPQVEVLLDTTVLSIGEGRQGRHDACVVGAACGLAHVDCGAVVLACGCRERTRGQINIAGGRPAGVLTAGTAQRLCNCDGAMAGREVVILGSGDIGLIMARRMTWEGAHVICVCELAAEPGGLRRNIVQCLEDNGIPLHLSTTVTQVFGGTRLTAVELADVDPATMRPIPGTERRVECDTLLLSVGLIPENSVAKTAGVRIDRATSGPAVDQSLATSVPGIFVAGNELHVHDLADYVSEEGEQAGANAADHALRLAAGVAPSAEKRVEFEVCRGDGVGSVTPQRVDPTSGEAVVRLRTRERVADAQITIRCGDTPIRRVRRRVVVPSEMQTIRLTSDDLAKVDGPVTVSCGPAPAKAAPKGGASE